MLKSVYAIYLCENPDVLEGNFMFAAQLSEYPSEEFLKEILDGAPEGYHYISVERSYTYA
jgi:hypothetical protein